MYQITAEPTHTELPFDYAIYTNHFQDLPRNKNKKIAGKGREPLTPERVLQYEEAENSLDEMTWDFDLDELSIAYLYLKHFPDIEAYPLRRSPWRETQKAWAKFNKTTKPAARLFGCLDTPHLYTLHAEHLGLDLYYGQAANFPLGSYDPALRAIWKAKLKELIAPPYFYKFENATRFHVHLIAAHNAGLPHISRNGEVIKKISAGDEVKVLGYLYKPHATYTLENLAMWVYAKRDFGLREKYLPRNCDYVGNMQRKKFYAEGGS